VEAGETRINRGTIHVDGQSGSTLSRTRHLFRILSDAYFSIVYFLHELLTRRRCFDVLG
jgi:hypothetical protein